jgi:hypothetical protein
MKAIGKTTSLKERGDASTQTEKFMKGNGTLAVWRARESSFVLTGLHSLASGRQANSMVMAIKSGPTVHNMKAISQQALSRVTAC